MSVLYFILLPRYRQFHVNNQKQEKGNRISSSIPAQFYSSNEILTNNFFERSGGRHMVGRRTGHKNLVIILPMEVPLARLQRAWSFPINAISKAFHAGSVCFSGNHYLWYISGVWLFLKCSLFYCNSIQQMCHLQYVISGSLIQLRMLFRLVPGILTQTTISVGLEELILSFGFLFTVNLQKELPLWHAQRQCQCIRPKQGDLLWKLRLCSHCTG